MSFRVVIISLVLMIASLFDALGQKSSILLTVVDEQTGETLIGATVMIAGTTLGTVTDFDGNASFKDIAAGTYTLKVSYISYQTTIISDIVVIPGKFNDLTVQLKPANLEINEVVVTAKTARNSENAILTLQKKSVKIFDAITSEQFSKLGASDAAGALKKVTGVTITDGKYVFVRGLGDRYSKSTLNGSDIPSLDPNKNAVQLDLFPSNLIDNIIVYKTFTPDLPGDFAGGLIDITTKDFPESFKLQLSVGFEYNDKANLNSDFLTADGSSTDIFGFDNGFRSLPKEISNYSIDNFPTPFPDNDRAGVNTVSKAFKNRQFQPGKGDQFLDHDLSFSIGNQIPLFKKQLGFVFGLSYKRSFSNYIGGVQNIYQGVSEGQTTLNNDIYTATTEQKSTDDVLVGAMFNTSYKINNRNKIGISAMADQSGGSENRYQDGYLLIFNPDSSTRLQNRVISYTQRSFLNGQIRGEHVLNILNKMIVNWSNSYTVSTIGQPDVRFLRNTYFFDENGDTSFYIGNNEKPYRFFRDLNETSNHAKLDFTLPVSLFNGLNSKIKFGSAYTYKNRSFRESTYYYSIQYNRAYDGDVSAFFIDENLGFVNNNELRNFLTTDFAEPNNYDANQKLLAAYLMIESRITNNISVTTGVRFEKTEMSLKAFDGTEGSIDVKDFLPSFALTYNIGELTNIRVSANRTLARPSFREFAPLATQDFTGGHIQNGNPDLLSTTINNFDLRFEKFPSPGEYLSFSLFYKQFFNPIENVQESSAGGSSSQFKYRNVDKSTLYGAEIEARKNLGVDGTWLQYFKVAANFSYVYAFVNVTADELQSIRTWDPGAGDTRPMYNQAPYSINASLSYENPDKGWESTLSFNVTGKRLIVYQIDLPSIYLQPMPDLNFTLKKDIAKHYSVRFRAKNILNNTYNEQMTLAGNDFYSTKYQLGRSYSLSFSYNF